MARIGEVTRTTTETDIRLRWNLDGQGHSTITTGIGFFDHMLIAFARHGFFDLEIEARGDLEVDAHHTVEDVGIALGLAFSRAIGQKTGIARFGTAFVPMDEALVMAAVDISGRPYLALELDVGNERVGQFPACLLEEFLRAFAVNAGLTLHLRKLSGRNAHHCLEAAFKALARALNQASSLDPRVEGLLSTKGTLGEGSAQ